jgi:hypothetical protein
MSRPRERAPVFYGSFGGIPASRYTLHGLQSVLVRRQPSTTPSPSSLSPLKTLPSHPFQKPLRPIGTSSPPRPTLPSPKINFAVLVQFLLWVTVPK